LSAADMTTKRKEKPWKKEPPKDAAHKKLTPAQKRSAKTSAKRAGRPYPNLVDNMRAAARKKKKKA